MISWLMPWSGISSVKNVSPGWERRPDSIMGAASVETVVSAVILVVPGATLRG
jgi:hypothetical protein